ncbi:hypothetical protein ACTG9Q_19405 [Actinokineospora sp. 24-640]
MSARKFVAGVSVAVALMLAVPTAAQAAGPRCPERAPAGAEFVRTVQPPWGLAYDLYRLDSGQLVSVYC